MAGLVTVERVGLVSLKKRHNGVFYLVYADKNSGKPVVQSTKQTDLDVALEQAGKLNKQLGSAKFADDEFKPVLLKEAFREAINRSNAKTLAHKKNLFVSANQFSIFLQANLPHVQYLHQIKAPIIYAFIDYLTEKKLAAKTISHYVHVVQLTINHWNGVYPDHVRTFKVKIPKGKNGTPKKNYLTIQQLQNIHSFLIQKERLRDSAIFALGAYAGLNLQEIADRKVEEFDFENNTVSIDESKNDHRTRIIPILPVVANAVKVWLEKRNYNSEWVFKQEVSENPINHRNIYQYLAPAIKQASIAYDDAELTSIAPKDLRKCFVNLAVEAGCELGWIEAYIGHAAKNILIKHYADLVRVKLMKDKILTPVQALLVQN